MSSEDEASSSKSGKWAAEAFGFLRFYQRVGNQLWGLILMEIGWAALLLLVSKLLPDEGPRRLRGAAITDIFLIGGIVIALWWSFSSGVYLYGWLIVQRVLRAGALLVLYATFSLLAAVRLIFNWREVNRTEKRLKDEEEAAEEKVPVPPAREETPMTPEAELNKKKTEEEALRDKSRFLKAVKLVDEKSKKPGVPWPLRVGHLFERPMEGCIKLCARLKSGGRIGLAPIYSFTFEEDSKAAKAPLQAFAAGVDRLQIKLRHLVSIQSLRFDVLPTAVNVKTSRQARLLRGLFGFDAVLWGSYVSTDPPEIALQLEAARPEPKKEESDWNRTWHDLDLFKNVSQIENEGMVIDQDDLLDAYIAVAMAMVHALNAREFRPGGPFGGKLDMLRLYKYSDPRVIISALVTDGLFSLPAEPLRRTAEPTPAVEHRRKAHPSRSNFSSNRTAKETLVDVAGKWVAQQLDSTGSWEERYPNEFLEDVAARCVELRPLEPENYYRLAAIRLILGKVGAARRDLDAATTNDTLARRIAPTPLSIKAGMAIRDLDHPSYQGREFREAQCAIYVARAVARGGDKVREDLATKFKETNVYVFRAYDKSPLSPSQTILFETLKLDDLAGSGSEDKAT
jgi:hypothetical protein